MSNPPDLGALRLNDHLDQEYDDMPYEEEDMDYDMDIDLGPTPSKPSAPRPETSESREAALRKELESVRQINKVIEDVVASLEKAKGNMDNVNRTVHSASTLLDTWTRILSQTEHNQRLLLNPNWQGATQDVQDIENESFVRQQQAERRAAEEQARRDAAQRRAEEEERKKSAPPPAIRGSKLRGRVSTASSRLTRQPSSASATSTSTPGYVGIGGQGGRGRGVPRAGSGIGRALKKKSKYQETAILHLNFAHSSHPSAIIMSIRSLSAITSEDISTDVLESPTYQRHQQCLDEYYTWLLSSSAGGLLTAQSVFLNSATRTLYRLSRECEHTTYELDQQGLRMSQTQQDVYELTQWCRLQANDIDARRETTFIEFSALNNYPLSRVQQAWDLATLSVEEITLRQHERKLYKVGLLIEKKSIAESMRNLKNLYDFF
ncbi:hypothetical protein E4T45_01050 [Aureobasidium sp. EXF-8846]|nr:hypothetical protein E4T45_01050 [Aureobasidium sp. EXF-8846]